MKTPAMFLTFQHVTKLYGPVHGVNDVHCRIGSGITGLLGSNGAGKSTLMKLAAGQLRPTLGRVLVGQHAAWSTAARWHLGYSPDLPPVYRKLTGREFLELAARLHGFAFREARRRSQWLLEVVGLTHPADRLLGGYSRGMWQRLKLAAALVHDPAVLLLDEPLSGIDPGGRRALGDMLRRLADEGKTILLSTHLLAEVEDLADQVMVLSRGRVVASGALHEIRQLLQTQPFTVLVSCGQPRRLAQLLVADEEVLSVEIHNQELTLRVRQPERFFQRLAAVALEHELPVQRFVALDTGADAVFDYLQQAAS